ncbi:hypothetical protein PC123_g26309 [Phytophthora cactorum]|nr:hypothetical protein PC123_g26309 [Phytophthora cactorum]
MAMKSYVIYWIIVNLLKTRLASEPVITYPMKIELILMWEALRLTGNTASFLLRRKPVIHCNQKLDTTNDNHSKLAWTA